MTRFMSDYLPETLQTSPRPRDVQIAEIGSGTLALRSRMWERLKFEVEYNRRQGTTANSFLIRDQATALIDPPGESFTQIYLEALQPYLQETPLNYIITSHVNRNRLATLAALIERYPQVTLVCSRPAAHALKTAFPEWCDRIQAVCPPQTTLDLGSHQLQLMTVPTPRWPDGLCTYDPTTQILFSDKLFGAHVCGDALFDEDWRHLEADRRHYFDCLHASQVKQVEAALTQIGRLSSCQCLAPGHGPLVRYSLSRLLNDYRQWCRQQAQQTFRVALIYASAYGNTATLANAIAQGLIQNRVSVESINCEHSDPADLAKAIETSDGFIIGSPTLGGHAPVQIQTALGVILSTAVKTKLAGVFGSYGWSGEAVDLLESKLRDHSYRFGFEPIRVRFSPDLQTLQTAQQAGAEFAQQLRRQKKRQLPRQAAVETQANRTEQAVGRIVGSLAVITTRQGDSHSGLLTSWISQATFSPPGIMVAISREQAMQRFLQPETPLVVNLLKEGRTVRRHFSSQPRPGEHPFTQIPHQLADNGCLILEDALAYLECTVQSWTECGDHWLVYAMVNQGDVLESKGVTAVQHRKSGSQY